MADPRVDERQPKVPGEEKEVSTGRMHQNVPDWSDPTCACEAEPYWQAVADEKDAKEKRGFEAREAQDNEPC